MVRPDDVPGGRCARREEGQARRRKAGYLETSLNSGGARGEATEIFPFNFRGDKRSEEERLQVAVVRKRPNRRALELCARRGRHGTERLWRQNKSNEWNNVSTPGRGDLSLRDGEEK